MGLGWRIEASKSFMTFGVLVTAPRTFKTRKDLHCDFMIGDNMSRRFFFFFFFYFCFVF